MVRYSEIGLKGSRVRDRMEQILIRNIKAGLTRALVNAEVRRSFGRVYIDNETDSMKTKEVLSRTMGVKSFSEAVPYEFGSLDDIVSKAVSLWSGDLFGKKFAIRARRTGTHNFRSGDIMRSVGDALYPYGSGVNLREPDIEFNIEVRDGTAYFFMTSVKGPGGLPLGSEGKYVALVSGGIDSPVATWSIMKRGCPVDMIFCSLAPPIDTLDFLRAVKPLVDQWGYGYNPRMHIIDGRKLVRLLDDRDKFKIPNITFKKILYNIAERIAERISANGIVTGESLGQVSSQTPESLHVLSSNMKFPVLRPLIGMDKDEITAIARNIGTFPETSVGEFCSLFSSTPITKPSEEELEYDIGNFDALDEIIETDFVIRGSEIDSYISSITGIAEEAVTVPGDAVVVDLRSKEKFDAWHYPGAINLDLVGVENLVESGDNKAPYVFYCLKGLQSAYAASLARESGKEAFFISLSKLKSRIETA